VRDQPLGVLGSGLGSVEHAQLIRQWSDDLIFFTHTDAVTDAEREELEARDIRIVAGEVRGLVVEDDHLRGVVLGDGRTVERAALFIRPEIRPRLDGLLGHLGCDTDELGFVRVDTAGRSSVPGVWAVGNAANPRAQVITAAGEGSAAAISINADLSQEDVDNALHAAPQSSRQSSKGIE
jgi:thioredoxin reductase